MRTGWGIGLLTLATMMAGAAHAQGLPAAPPGWTRAAEADLAGPDWESRKDKPHRYVRAEGDFNGDGQADRAELLVNRTTQRFGLFVFLAGAKAATELDGGKLGELTRLGISTQQPGRRQTTCGKGYDRDDPKCLKGIPFVDVKHASIGFFMFESATSEFYWTGSKFEHFWTSD